MVPASRQTCSVFLVCCCVILFNAATTQAQDFAQQIRTTDPLSPDQELQTFQVPDGFEVTLFASEPDIPKPMNLAFDAQGRLWASGSNDYPYPNLDGTATDSIRVLEDSDGDGRADKVTTFVEGITIPIGLYPYADGVIAFSIPNIVHYRDTDGDGKADTSQILYGPFDFSRDTHGLNNAFRRGLDGWIYACHGFNNNSEVAGLDGHKVSMQSGNIYRFKLDGSRIEQFTHGQVNPFGMVIDKYGDIYTSDCHTKPMTLLIHDGYYESFGKPHDGLGFVPATMEHLHGSTAIAGIGYQSGPNFPEEFRNNFFIGNVMTSRVHRDTIAYTGSTAKAVEQPEFMTTSDPWFRPVDIQCGPDGAIYVADFYNRVIGHYEVPLDHPGRDRFRGRIWKVTYVGDRLNEPATPQDLTKLAVHDLIAILDNENLPTVDRAVEQIVDRVGTSAVPALKEALNSSAGKPQQAYILWTLHQLDALDLEMLHEAADSPNEIVRIHVQKILEARPAWTPEDQHIAEHGLRDESGLVRRSAAIAFSQHPHQADLNLLLDALEDALPDDVHLKHALKISLKSFLQTDGAYRSIDLSTISQSESELLANVSQAVKSRDAAHFLMEVIDKVDLPDDVLQNTVTIAARYVEPESVVKLIDLTRTRFGNDPDQQLAIIQAITAGLEQQGEKLPGDLQAWARTLINSILENSDPGLSDWESIPLRDNRPIAWNVEPRNTQDGKREMTFLSSLPAGERAVGILQTKPFALPQSLSFYVCGHLGFPNEPAINKNTVTLHLVKDDQLIETALPPRNDTARKVTWDLTPYQGQMGYVKVTDDVDVSAYAWIAVSGFDPPIARIPQLEVRAARQRLIAAAQLSARLGLHDFKDQFAAIATDPGRSGAVREAALAYLTSQQSNAQLNGLSAFFNDETSSEELKNQIAHLVVHPNEEQFNQLLKSLSLQQQTAFSRTMSQSQNSAEELSQLIEQGTISPEVLRSDVVKGQLAGLPDGALKQKFVAMFTALPPANDKIAQLIEQWKSQFVPNSVDLAAGQAVFTKNCAACHSISGEGKKIGPQLDGIGNRGLERVLEDVLAPNRNIDVAFRSRTYALDDGKVYSGLFRREEGNLVVIANNKGEEITFAKDEIDVERVSPLSIMPENWGEAIPQDDFRQLLGYLLEQRLKQ